MTLAGGPPVDEPRASVAGREVESALAGRLPLRHYDRAVPVPLPAHPQLSREDSSDEVVLRSARASPRSQPSCYAHMKWRTLQEFARLPLALPRRVVVNSCDARNRASRMPPAAEEEDGPGVLDEQWKRRLLPGSVNLPPGSRLERLNSRVTTETLRAGLVVCSRRRERSFRTRSAQGPCGVDRRNAIGLCELKSVRRHRHVLVTDSASDVHASG